MSDFYATETCGTYKHTYSVSSSEGSKPRVTYTQANNRARGVLQPIVQFFWVAFLPEGYPDSVSDDYTIYQLYDTGQALCSSLAGVISTKAILTGAGVGDATKTATAAVVSWIIRDGCGMTGRIAFAWLHGSSLDNNAKQWRLVADVLNDIALTLDVVTLQFPTFFLPITCVSSILKAIVGIAGSATRASLTLHQAKRNNMADVSAKDGTQETLVNLMGIWLAMITMHYIGDNTTQLCVLFCVCVCAHLWCNYKAVSSIVLDSLNDTRFDIVMDSYLVDGHVPSPEVVNKAEGVFLKANTHNIHLGVSINELVHTSNAPNDNMLAADLLHALHTHPYTLTHAPKAKNGAKMRICVAFRAKITSLEVIRARFHARVLQRRLSDPRSAELAHHVHEAQIATNKLFDRFVDELHTNGWKTFYNRLHCGEWRVMFDRDKND